MLRRFVDERLGAIAHTADERDAVVHVLALFDVLLRHRHAWMCRTPSKTLDTLRGFVDAVMWLGDFQAAPLQTRVVVLLATHGAALEPYRLHFPKNIVNDRAAQDEATWEASLAALAQFAQI